jgi:hypothetical protein
MNDVAASGFWKADFDETALSKWARLMRRELRVSLGLLY